MMIRHGHAQITFCGGVEAIGEASTNFRKRAGWGESLGVISFSPIEEAFSIRVIFEVVDNDPSPRNHQIGIF